MGEDVRLAGGGGDVGRLPEPRRRRGEASGVEREQAEQDVRAIVEEVAATSAGSAPGSVARSVGDLYGSFMDEDAVEAAGLTPIRAELAAAGAVATPSDVLALLGRWLRIGVSGLIHPYVSSDNADPDATILYLEQGGISLPDESYYREAAHEAARTAYPDHVARMLALAKYPDPQGSAAAVMALETRLAGGHWDNVTTRDPVKTYNRRSLAELRLTTHLRPIGSGYVLALQNENTKAGLAHEFPVPEPLVPYLTRYLECYRLLFPHQDHEDALWLSAKGGALTDGAIYLRVCRRTRTAFGTAIHPHLFRDIAATTISREAPESLAVARDLVAK